MPTLQHGARHFLNLGAGQVLTVTCDAVSSAVVRSYPIAPGGEATGQSAVAASGTYTRGPFMSATRWAVEAAGSGVSYAIAGSADADATVDASGNVAANGSPVSGDGTPRNRIVKRGSKLIDTTIDTGWTFSGPGVVWSVSGEWSRRGAVSRKCDMTNATGDAVAAWSSATGVAASSIDQLIAFDLGIPDIVQPYVGGSVSVDVFISNTTTESAPGTRWVVNSNYLRQLWNEIRLCGLDADGALGANRGTGTLPYGMSKAGASGGASPLDWSQPIKFIKITITYNALNKRVLYLDSEIRIPDKIKPFVCLGQDATGSSLSDNIYTQRLAPFLASRKVPWYFTMCWVYDGLYQGTADDARRDILLGTYGCDAVNHSYDHGASVPGAYYASGNTLTISGGGTLATLVLSGAHGWTVGSRVFIAVNMSDPANNGGASRVNALGVFLATVINATTLTYPITGGTDGVVTGTVRASTYLNDVISASAVTNQPIVLPASVAQALCDHEFVDLHNRYSRPKGMLRGSSMAAYPNNSLPDMKYMVPTAEKIGLKLARGLYGTTVRISEFGVDNPLAMGAFEFNSGANGSTLQDYKNAVQGAINRGEGLLPFGHYYMLRPNGAVAGSPPGLNGNASAGGSSPTLWWHIEDLEDAVDWTIGLANQGLLDFVSASQLVDQVGQ